MSQNFNFSELTSDLSLPQLKYACPMIMTADRSYHTDFENQIYQPGDFVNIRYPNFWRVQEGNVMAPQSWQETSIPLAINVPIGGNFATDTQENALFITKNAEKWQERYIAPIIMATSANIENRALDHLEVEANYFAGSPNSAFSSFTFVDLVSAQMSELGMPTYGDINLVLSPRDMSALKSDNQNAFNPTLNTDISFYSRLGRYSKFNLYTTSANKIHVCGSGAGTPQVNGLFTSGTTMNLKGFTPNATNVITKGDILTFGSLSDGTGIQSINNVSQLPTGQLMPITVGAGPNVLGNYNADGAGNVTVNISAPAIGLISDQSLQRTNISGAIPDGTVVNIIGAGGSYKLGAAYSSRGLAMVFPKLPELATPFCVSVEDPEARIAFRIARQADLTNGLNAVRTDILHGIRFFDQYVIKIISKAD